jgi:hypothetical protein
MTKQKINPEIQQAFAELFRGLSEKSSVKDYPCKDVPCEYWWVRYAVACTYLSKAQDEIWQPKIEELQTKYNFSGYSYTGKFSLKDTKPTKKDAELYLKAKIWVFSTKQKRDIEVTNKFSELYRVIEQRLQNNIEWYTCPYEMDKQSKCPFYKASEFYKQKLATNVKDGMHQ